MVGRFWSVDPLTSKYPWYTPYQFAGNKPIWATDLDGMEEWETNNGSGKSTYGPISPEFAASKGLSAKGESKKFKIPLSKGEGEFGWHEPWQKSSGECLNCNEVTTARVNGKNYEISMDVVGMESLNPSIGRAEGLSGIAPVYSSGRNAIDAFQNGQYVRGTFNGVMAVSDLLLVKSIIKGVSKGGLGAMKLGDAPWSKAPWMEGPSYRTHYLQSGFAESKQPLHHWLLNQNQGIGKSFPSALKNQQWNLMSIKPLSINGIMYDAGTIHRAIHNSSRTLKFNTLQKLYYGTPQWLKTGAFSTGGRAID